MDKLNLFHLNVRKSHTPCKSIRQDLSNFRNVILGLNEPRFSLKTQNITDMDIFDKVFCFTKQGVRSRAALCMKGDKLNGTLLSQFSCPDICTVDVNYNGNHLIIISAYLPPDENYNSRLDLLNETTQKLRNLNKPVIVITDSNSRSTMWNDILTNERGKLFEDFILNNELLICNDNDVNTFVSTQGSSTIDLVLCNVRAMELNPFVYVDQQYDSLSDHKRINIELNFGTNELNEFCQILTENPYFARTFAGKTSTRKFVIKENLWPIFDENLKKFNYILDSTNFNVDNEVDADYALDKLNDFLDKVCYCTFPILKYKEKKPRDTNERIKELEKLIDNRKRRYDRLLMANSFQCADALNELEEVKELHKKEYHDFLRNKWRELVSTSGDSKKAYKLYNMSKGKLFCNTFNTIKKDNGEYTNSKVDTLDYIFEKFFPNNNHPKVKDYVSSLPPENVFFSMKEVVCIIKNLNNKKAPGPDGFTGEILKRALDYIIEPLTQFYNALLRINYFPKHWKHGFVILIPKASANNSGEKTIKDKRPITLLSIKGKIFERLVVDLLNKYLYINNCMDLRQYGFCKQTSTVDALTMMNNHIYDEIQSGKSVILVLLDISGAFDNAAWYRMIELLENDNVPEFIVNFFKSYFKDRENCISTGDVVMSKKLTQGCPQGSVSGPSLWNVLLNDLFKELDRTGINNQNEQNFHAQAFADDSAACFSYYENENSILRVEKYLEKVLKIIYEWGQNNHLNFNVSKTQVIRFSKKKILRLPEVKFNDDLVPFSEKVKYLGLWFDTKLTFVPHVLKKLEEAKMAYSIMRCITANTWGIDPELCRLIYITVILPIFTYGCSIWFRALKYKNISVKLRTFQYLCCKSIVKGYKTISIVNATILSDTLPIAYHVFKIALIELTRVYGTINPIIYEKELFDQQYKPNFEVINLEFYRKHTSTKFFFDEEDYEQEMNMLLSHNSKDHYMLEPKIHWTDVPTGTDRIQIEQIEDIPKDYDFYIYSDGSKIQERGVGGSFVIYDNCIRIGSNEITFNPRCSVYQSEQYSIYGALKWLLNSDRNIINKKIVVCTDSLSSIQGTIKFYTDNFMVFLINKCSKEFEDKNTKISFCKIKGHSGIKGNEIADDLAKKAAKRSIESSNFDYNFMSLKSVKSYLNNRCWVNWTKSVFDFNVDLDRAKINEITINFIPKKENLRTFNFMKLSNFYTSQFITGHGPFNNFRKKFGFTEQNVCPDCKISNDGPIHILFECSSHTEIHRRLISIEIRKPRDLNKVFLKDNIELFKDICKEIYEHRIKCTNDTFE